MSCAMPEITALIGDARRLRPGSLIGHFLVVAVPVSIGRPSDRGSIVGWGERSTVAVEVSVCMVCSGCSAGTGAFPGLEPHPAQARNNHQHRRY